jgi:hypothetical protein
MIRVAMILWGVVATTLAGMLIVVVLTVPSLAAHDAKLILPAVLIGCVLAMPISYLISKKLHEITKK